MTVTTTMLKFNIISLSFCLLPLLFFLQLNMVSSVRLGMVRKESNDYYEQECDASKMPIVLLGKFSSKTTEGRYNDQKASSSSSFREIKRWEHPEHFFDNLHKLHDLLILGMNHSISENNNYTTLQSLKDEISKLYGIPDFSFRRRRLEEEENDNSNNNNGTTIMGSLSTITIIKEEMMEGYYLTRECSCFRDDDDDLEVMMKNTNTSSFCPLVTPICRREISLSHNNSIIIPITTCLSEASMSGWFNLRSFLYLTIASMIYIVFFTHKCHSCMSFLPAKLMEPKWNQTVAYLLLRFRPRFAKRQIRNHVMEEHRAVVRQQVGQQIAAALADQRRESVQAYFEGDDAANNQTTMEEGGENSILDNHQKPTSLVLRTRILRSNDSSDSNNNKQQEKNVDDVTNDSDNNRGKLTSARNNDDDFSAKMDNDEEEGEKNQKTIAMEETDRSKEEEEEHDENLSKTSKDSSSDNITSSCSSTNDEDNENTRTIIMKKNSSQDSSATKEDVCSICLLELEDGDRVGALPCNHVFHVECLKKWLPKRNVCPLCQIKEVASPRYE